MNKWTLWLGLILIVIIFILLWQFAPVIQRWLADTFVHIIVIVLVFAAGWMIGRYGGNRKRARKAQQAAEDEQ